MITHKIDMTPERALFLLSRRYDNVRYWFCTYGNLVGVWKAKNGKEYAIGMNPARQTIIYRTGQ